MSHFTFDWVLQLIQDWCINLSILTTPFGRLIDKVTTTYFNITIPLPPIFYDMNILSFFVPQMVLAILIIHLFRLIKG